MAKAFLDDEEFLDQKINGQEFTHAIVENKDFENCTFHNCPMTETSFRFCHFHDCVFEQCDLSLAKFE